MKPNDVAFMQRAIGLAAQGKGRVSPNPCVGCVIVKNGAVVGEGYHPYFGGPHAEIVALRQAGGKARGADMYVSLEPCVHTGKTGPCTPKVIEAGLKSVHIAMRDPFPKVAGRGIRALRAAGIRVTVGLEEDAARLLNRSFVTYVTRRRPHVVLKMAASLDGKIATREGETRWISGPVSRRLVHSLRAESDAVLVGASTAAADDPALTSHGAGRDPLRVVIDPRLRLPPRLALFNDGKAPTLVVTATHAPVARERALLRRGVDVFRVPARKGRIQLATALTALAERGIAQLLVEGGGETAWHFIEAGLVDEVVFFLAPLLIGGRTAPTPVGGEGFRTIAGSRRLTVLSTVRVGDDVLVHAMVGGN